MLGPANHCKISVFLTLSQAEPSNALILHTSIVIYKFLMATCHVSVPSNQRKIIFLDRA